MPQIVDVMQDLACDEAVLVSIGFVQKEKPKKCDKIIAASNLENIHT